MLFQVPFFSKFVVKLSGWRICFIFLTFLNGCSIFITDWLLLEFQKEQLVQSHWFIDGHLKIVYSDLDGRDPSRSLGDKKVGISLEFVNQCTSCFRPIKCLMQWAKFSIWAACCRNHWHKIRIWNLEWLLNLSNFRAYRRIFQKIIENSPEGIAGPLPNQSDSALSYYARS